MGKTVLPVGSDASSFLRAYAHCSRGSVRLFSLTIIISNERRGW